MNNCVMIGRLTRDPELKYTGNGTAYCRFSIAVDREFKKQDGEKEVDFIDITTWSKTAENVAKYLAKGRQVGVKGRLQINSYQDNDGNNRKSAEIIAERVEFLGNIPQGNKTLNNGEISSENQFENIGEEVIFSDDDLPF